MGSCSSIFPTGIANQDTDLFLFACQCSIHTFGLVLTYGLLEKRCTDDI